MFNGGKNSYYADMLPPYKSLYIKRMRPLLKKIMPY